MTGGGIRPGGATTLPGQIGGGNGGNRPGLGGRPGLSMPPGERPSLGGMTKPSFPQPNFPGPSSGNRPGTGLGGGGGGNRPVTLPGQIGGGGTGNNRPGIGGNRPGTGDGNGGPGLGGNRPGIGGGNRPVTLPGQIGGGNGGDRPGIGGNRPGSGGNRPGIGGDRPGSGNRPWAGNRPGDRPGRPGIGGNRPGINAWTNLGSGGNIGSGNWGNNNNFNNINVNGGGGWGYPGYGGGYGGGYGYGGYGDWGHNWNNGFVNPAYNGWYSGCWNGNWVGGYGGGWWAPLAFGAATWGALSAVNNWGLGYGTLGYAGGAYVNPYYSSMPSAVVSSSPYDYSQPVMVSNYVTNDGDLTNSTDAQGGAGGSATTGTEANAAVDAALEKFKAGDYAGALSGFDRAVKLSPNDSVIHEVRALTLFALGRYPEAAATLNSVLAAAPGMDWTTISNVYGSVDAYTTHLRKLEEFCRSHPDDAPGHFVLGYHYLVGGHADMAAEALKVAVAKQPGDLVAKRLLDAITPPAEPKAGEQQSTAPATPGSTGTSGPAPSAPETDLVGSWQATIGKDSVVLTITEDSKFTWKATPAGKPAVELSGDIDTSRDAIALRTETAGTMEGMVASKGPDAFEFTLAGAPKEAKPLLFKRQPSP
jgi:tetratricopeptide (TPR) repeat protein